MTNHSNNRQFIPTEKGSTIQFAKLFYFSLSGNMNDLSVLMNSQTLLNGKCAASNLSNLDTIKEDVN